MPTAIKIGLLGPLQVRRDGAAVPVAARRQRAVLAALPLSGLVAPPGSRVWLSGVSFPAGA